MPNCGLYKNATDLIIKLRSENAIKKHSHFEAFNKVTEQPNENNPAIDENIGENSVSESNQSGGTTSGHTGSSNSTSRGGRDLIDRSFSDETPSSIKKLAALIGGCLLVIIILICT